MTPRYPTLGRRVASNGPIARVHGIGDARSSPAGSRPLEPPPRHWRICPVVRMAGISHLPRHPCPCLRRRKAGRTECCRRNLGQSEDLQTMKAWRVHSWGEPESMMFDDVPMPSLGESVRIRNPAAGLNFFDILQVQASINSSRPFHYAGCGGGGRCGRQLERACSEFTLGDGCLRSRMARVGRHIR